MIVFLHGAGERGTDLDLVRRHGIPKHFGADPDYHGLRVITLSPQCPENQTWNHLIPELMDLITAAARQYHADPDRISLTGLSMGGFGTWELGISYPSFFSAMAPICGGGISGFASVLANMPLRVYHGELDTVIPIMYSQMMVDAVRAAGGHPEFFTYPDIHHEAWVPAYDESDLIEWLAAQDRRQRI